MKNIIQRKIIIKWQKLQKFVGGGGWGGGLAFRWEGGLKFIVVERSKTFGVIVNLGFSLLCM